MLKAFDIPASSQTLVFSENSLQRDAHQSKPTPRAIYFNDTVAVGWAKGADTIEATVLDATQGVQFYSIRQVKQEKPQFARRGRLPAVPSPAADARRSGLADDERAAASDNQNEYAQGWEMDHRTPIEDRWGGWYVTGAQVPAKHLGNVPVLHVPTLLRARQHRAETDDRKRGFRHRRVPDPAQRRRRPDGAEPSDAHE